MKAVGTVLDQTQQFILTARGTASGALSPE